MRPFDALSVDADMISISTLYCGAPSPSHALRYGRGSARGASGPVIVYNCTARCNLACAHCYSASGPDADTADELTGDEARALLDDLARAGAPVVLFSGGEPLLRADLPDLIAHAAAAGIRPVVSSNGTLITAAVALALADAGCAYVGVSLDGLAGTHDAFRRRDGAFAEALAGMDRAADAGIKVGVRMTLTAGNAADVPGVFALIAERGVRRICFYHLVPSGRGRDGPADLTAERRRAVLDRIMDLTAEAWAAGRQIEVLTVDNHADGPYVVLRLLREDPPRAARALDLLRANGGNASGVRLAAVAPTGDVLPDPFWHARVLGNVRRRPFSEIWSDPGDDFLAALRRRPRPVTGRCAACRWLDVCNGNFRARAETVTGETWAADPGCHLTDEEIST